MSCFERRWLSAVYYATMVTPTAADPLKLIAAVKTPTARCETCSAFHVAHKHNIALERESFTDCIYGTQRERKSIDSSLIKKVDFAGLRSFESLIYSSLALASVGRKHCAKQL